MKYRILTTAALVGLIWSGTLAAMRQNAFDSDPHWQGSNNRMTPDRVATQDFGYSATNFAGKEKGEIGGEVQRSTVPAYYAEKIVTRTLNDKLSASGTFAVTRHSGSGVCFGWFNSNQQDGVGRPVGSLGLEIGFKSRGGTLAVRLITDQNQSCGLLIAPRVRTKPLGPGLLHADGARYRWKLDYDPQGDGGNGQIQCTLHGDASDSEDFEGKVFTINLPPNFRKEGATFDRFGLMNIMKTGGTMDIYFGDLTCDGKRIDLAADPKWMGDHNRGEFHEREQVSFQDFGFSPTHFAGGKPGEIGGTFWRTERGWSYYADAVGALTLNDPLQASGKVSLRVGAPDSAMYIGWFNSAGQELSPAKSGDFLGVQIEGPTRVGHYFSPGYTTANGTRGRAEGAPVIIPGRTYDWSLKYDPKADGGAGAIRVTLDGKSVTLALKPGSKSEGARFDHFGLMTANPGGQMVKIYFDDLKYTAESNRR
jgi:hypothetical protein